MRSSCFGFARCLFFCNSGRLCCCLLLWLVSFSFCISPEREAALSRFFVVVFFWVCSPISNYYLLLLCYYRLLPRLLSRFVSAKLMATLIYYHNNNFLAILGLLLCACGWLWLCHCFCPLDSLDFTYNFLGFSFARFAGYLLCGFHGLIWDFSEPTVGMCVVLCVAWNDKSRVERNFVS